MAELSKRYQQDEAEKFAKTKKRIERAKQTRLRKERRRAQTIELRKQLAQELFGGTK